MFLLVHSTCFTIIKINTGFYVNIAFHVILVSQKTSVETYALVFGSIVSHIKSVDVLAVLKN